MKYKDYKEVEQTDDIIKKFYSLNLMDEKPGNRVKYYVVKGDCLKSLLMSAQTLLLDIYLGFCLLPLLNRW